MQYVQNRNAALFDGIDASITSLFDNDTNDFETRKLAAIARFEEAELQHLHELEEKRHQIQVILVIIKI